MVNSFIPQDLCLHFSLYRELSIPYIEHLLLRSSHMPAGPSGFGLKVTFSERPYDNLIKVGLPIPSCPSLIMSYHYTLLIPLEFITRYNYVCWQFFLFGLLYFLLISTYFLSSSLDCQLFNDRDLRLFCSPLHTLLIFWHTIVVNKYLCSA